MDGWIGVDLDGTLAEYDRWEGPTTIGAPIPAMVDRVKRWLSEGREVRIFTARACPRPHEELQQVLQAVEGWSLEHIGIALPITCIKDFGMEELWDDRAVSVEPNTGRALAPSRRGLDNCGACDHDWYRPQSIGTPATSSVPIQVCRRCEATRPLRMEGCVMTPERTIPVADLPVQRSSPWPPPRIPA
jgi:hypothetical protein